MAVAKLTLPDLEKLVASNILFGSLYRKER